jgi:YrbI family 3-deoxy-D-manno-octulosonate 8-phosphate phosphatase
MSEERAKKIKLLIMDVDGVLTDGRIIYGPDGSEFKSFHVRDGHAMKLAKRAGLKMAIITGRDSEIVTRRGEELEVDFIYQKVFNKLEVYEKILKENNLKDEEVAFIGDDIVDLSVMRRVGLSIAVEDAAEELRQESLLITKNPGGRGAVREVIEYILKARGLWEDVTKRYY